VSIFVLLLAGNLLLSPDHGATALFLCRNAVTTHLETGRFIETGGLPPEFNRPAAVFVTIRKNGTTRGCAGSLTPLFATLGESLIRFAVIAATQDARFPSLSRPELQDVRFIITLPGEVVPLSSLASYNPLTEGLLVRKNGREGIIVPHEAKTAAYALRQCRRQAGIEEGEEYSLYKFSAFTLAEETRK